MRSKNVATVRLAQEVGIGRVQKLAEEAGVEPPIPDQPSMALGTVSVSPLELAGAFTTFASLGERAVPRVVTKVEAEDGKVVWQADEPDRERVLDPAVAYLVTDALREALVRGTGQEVLQTGFRAPAAGKTGTTNDGADAWFVGYTPEVVAAVWVGFDERRPIMARATGGRLAAPVWARMMMQYQQKRPAGAWAAPANVIEGMVDPASGMLLASGCRPWEGTAYRELFVRGRAPQTVCPTRGEVQMLEPWQLPPLPDIEEGMQTGVPLEELALEAPEGMPDPSDVTAGSSSAAGLPGDPSAALPPDPAAAGMPAADVGPGASAGRSHRVCALVPARAGRRGRRASSARGPDRLPASVGFRRPGRRRSRRPGGRRSRPIGSVAARRQSRAAPDRRAAARGAAGGHAARGHAARRGPAGAGVDAHPGATAGGVACPGTSSRTLPNLSQDESARPVTNSSQDEFAPRPSPTRPRTSRPARHQLVPGRVAPASCPLRYQSSRTRPRVAGDVGPRHERHTTIDSIGR